MEAALRAIAEPRRRQILELVREHELSAGAIASQFDVSAQLLVAAGGDDVDCVSFDGDT